MSKNAICVANMDDCPILESSQPDIDKVMNDFNEDRTSYNMVKTKGDPVYELLGIGIKRLDDGGFKFYQPELIHKVLEATGMDNCNGLKKTNKVEANIETDKNGTKANSYCPNLYVSIIGWLVYSTSDRDRLGYHGV